MGVGTAPHSRCCYSGHALPLGVGGVLRVVHFPFFSNRIEPFAAQFCLRIEKKGRKPPVFKGAPCKQSLSLQGGIGVARKLSQLLIKIREK